LSACWFGETSLEEQHQGPAEPKEYGEKLDILFDISHANSNELITNEEDRQFMKLQQESRAGCLGSVDRKTFCRDKRSAERKERQLK
jgi:hypothetical protein